MVSSFVQCNFITVKADLLPQYLKTPDADFLYKNAEKP